MRSRPGDMVKKAHLQPYLTTNELKIRYRQKADAPPRRRPPNLGAPRMQSVVSHSHRVIRHLRQIFQGATSAL